MTKVVINADFGGFSLSVDGIEAYLARKGKKAYWFDMRLGMGGTSEERRPVTKEEAKRSLFFMCYTSETPTDENHFNDRDIERDDPDLVALVEEDREMMSGRYARLIVTEIPDDVNWTIEEYDGNEWVAEVHRTWR